MFFVSSKFLDPLIHDSLYLFYLNQYIFFFLKWIEFSSTPTLSFHAFSLFSPFPFDYDCWERNHELFSPSDLKVKSWFNGYLIGLLTESKTLEQSASEKGLDVFNNYFILNKNLWAKRGRSIFCLLAVDCDLWEKMVFSRDLLSLFFFPWRLGSRGAENLSNPHSWVPFLNRYTNSLISQKENLIVGIFQKKPKI